MKKLTLILAATAFAAIPASAQMVSPTEVGGNVSVSCSITGADAAVAFTGMDTYGQATDVTTSMIDVFCNQPAQISFESANGYLAHESDVPTGQANLESATNVGFNAAIDYSYGFDASVTTSTGSPIAWSSALQPAGGVANFGTNAINVTGASLTFSTVSNTNMLPVLSGDYSDDLTVTITPAGF